MSKNVTDLDWQEIIEYNPSGEVKKEIGSSFFRGKDCNFNPYKKDFENNAFLEKFLVKGWTPDKALINKNTKITAFGSCFASHITNHLSQIGYNLSKNRDSEIYISSMGEGLVNTFSILQQFEWALENIIPPDNLWHGYKAEEFGYKEDIRLRTQKIFLDTDFFILTLGLSEIWYDEITGGVFWRAIPQKYFDATRHKFRVSTFEETKNNITKIIQLINKHIPKAKVLFTLSPVPLAATFRPVSCITANSVSKSILRSALDEFIRENLDALNKKIYYFPSYEIITELFPDKYVSDNRHPHNAIIAFTMKLFEAIYCEGQLTLEDVNKSFQEVRKNNIEDLATYKEKQAVAPVAPVPFIVEEKKLSLPSKVKMFIRRILNI